MPESLLTTKAKWDEIYAEELTHLRDSKVEGEDWFSGDSDRIFEWLLSNASGCKPQGTKFEYLEVGCGNGLFMKKILDAFSPAGAEAVGVYGFDYSEAAVEYSREVMAESEVKPHLFCADVRELRAHEVLGALRCQVVHDKGTLDVFAMNSDPSELQAYFENVLPCVAPGGIFVVTSCNLAPGELLAKVTAQTVLPDHSFELQTLLKHPSVTFGGQTGQTLTSLCFLHTKKGDRHCAAPADDDW